MTTKTKYIIGALGAVTLIVGGYFAVSYYKILANYKKVVSESKAIEIIDTKCTDINPKEIDYKELGVSDSEENEDNKTGVMLGCEDDIIENPAVLINGLVLKYDESNFKYVYNNDIYYDMQSETYCDTQGCKPINSETLVYGTTDENGRFTYA